MFGVSFLIFFPNVRFYWKKSIAGKCHGVCAPFDRPDGKKMQRDPVSDLSKVREIICGLLRMQSRIPSRTDNPWVVSARARAWLWLLGDRGGVYCLLSMRPLPYQFSQFTDLSALTDGVRVTKHLWFNWDFDDVNIKKPSEVLITYLLNNRFQIPTFLHSSAGNVLEMHLK